MAITQAIPIPLVSTHIKQTHISTTPSLQSVLDQKKLSISSSTSVQSNVTTASLDYPLSVSSCCSLETCDEDHPLMSFDLINVMSDIDEDFFKKAEIIEQDSDYEHDKIVHTKLLKKSSFASNFSKSIREFALKQTDLNLFNIQPRLTDDKFIKPKETELETFKKTTPNTLIPSKNHPTTQISSTSTSQFMIQRHREPRINSQFLRLYAYEASSRHKGILPEVSLSEEEDFLHQKINPSEILHKNDPRKMALLVRSRLWQSVVLPPLNINQQNHCQDEYIHASQLEQSQPLKSIEKNSKLCTSSSLVRKQGHLIPWITYEDELSERKHCVLRPKGVLGKNLQFTVKGWVNSRFV